MNLNLPAAVAGEFVSSKISVLFLLLDILFLPAQILDPDLDSNKSLRGPICMAEWGKTSEALSLEEFLNGGKALKPRVFKSSDPGI